MASSIVQPSRHLKMSSGMGWEPWIRSIPDGLASRDILHYVFAKDAAQCHQG